MNSCHKMKLRFQKISALRADFFVFNQGSWIQYTPPLFSSSDPEISQISRNGGFWAGRLRRPENFAISVYLTQVLKGNRAVLISKPPKFSCLRRKMVTLYCGYQARRRRERKFWILVLNRDENRAVGARKFWILVLYRGGNRAVGARNFLRFRVSVAR